MQPPQSAGDRRIRIAIGLESAADRRAYSQALRDQGHGVLEFDSCRSLAEYILDRRRELDSPLDTLQIDIAVVDWPAHTPREEALRYFRTAGFQVPVIALGGKGLSSPFESTEPWWLVPPRWLEVPLDFEDLATAIEEAAQVREDRPLGSVLDN